ncbi:MAG: GNAT family N-acetyltransferase [Chloroflexi bacterium]|nr:GNAT family N-acetyltransferase [Chloroflexota bacterium]
MTTQSFWVEPTMLEGTHVMLEPLAQKHADDLFAAAQPDEIWEWLVAAQPKTREEMRAWIQRAEQDIASRKQLWFAIIVRADNRAVGVTSYMDIHPKDRGLEIGGTWLTPAVWRTSINTECKYLLLRHAFENLGYIRVQLKTDARNLRSQRAIERLGAIKEGVLRKHVILHTGYQRDTVMFSIIDSEWAGVKARLEEKLGQQTQ